jgi:tetratricopeptide (TPR) repeat protein
VVALLVTARGITAYGLSLKADFDAADFKMEEAEAGYQRALRLEPRYWQAYIGLGHLYAGQAFWNRDPETKARQIEKAEQAYQSALAINTWEGSAAFGLSRLYNLKGQPEEALRMLQGVVGKDALSPRLLESIGPAVAADGPPAGGPGGVPPVALLRA